MGISLLVQVLTPHAAPRRRVGHQSLKADFAAAIDAVAEIQVRQAFQSGLHLAYLVHLAVHEGSIHVHEHVGNRVIAGIGHAACQIGIMLVSRALKFARGFLPSTPDSVAAELL